METDRSPPNSPVKNLFLEQPFDSEASCLSFCELSEPRLCTKLIQKHLENDLKSRSTTTEHTLHRQGGFISFPAVVSLWVQIFVFSYILLS